VPPAALGPSSAARRSTALAALLLLAACGFVVAEPWHGPMVLALSEDHGLDAADLPALPLAALALVAHRRRAGGRMAAAAAVALGLLLVAGVLVPRLGSPLVPAGGGTFGGTTQHVDGRRAEPVGRWTHLAVTYDGGRYRLYVGGRQASSRSASGAILRTTDPLWIGGNHPYGEYFRGVIDEVRVYDRALSRSEVVAAMAAPLRRGAGPDPSHLVAAYPFDAGRGRTAADASGRGNAGRIRGATWTSSGRFGAGLRFTGADDVVRVPASASLNLRTAMTLMAWIRPGERQSGWRTVLARQTDAYFLAAGGGREGRPALTLLDRARFVLGLLLIVAIGSALSRGPVGRGSWSVPVMLFVAGSLVDVTFTPLDTLIGPALVALWGAVALERRAARVSMGVLAAAFAAATVLSIAGRPPLSLPSDDGGVVRSAALGVLLVVAGVLSVRQQRGAPR
jgi:hypothetical protein